MLDNSKDDAVAAKVRQVRLNLADPTQALVPVAGGHGAFGRGLQVMKARNAGEAKWAKRQARSHIEQRKREAFKTRVGYVHNNQKRKHDSGKLVVTSQLISQISVTLFVRTPIRGIEFPG